MRCNECEVFMVTHLAVEFPPAVADHLGECERCRQLTGIFQVRGPLAEPPPQQVKQIQEMILEHLTAVRPLASPYVFLSAFALICTLIFFAGSLYVGPAGWRKLSNLQRLAVFVPLASCAGLLALSMVRQMAPGSLRASSPAIWSVFSFGTLAVCVMALFECYQESDFANASLRCFAGGLAFGALTAVCLTWVFRRGAMLSPGLAGFSVGGLAGLTGLAVLEACCPNLNGYHILASHLTVVLFSSLAGMAMGLAGVRFRNHQRW